MRGLNEPQLKAVETLDGPVLVLAGAGTGKTRALTTRLAHLLYTNRARPYEILAVTFTNKAAGEMRERVSQLLGGQPVEGWWLGTFHALAARMLRRNAELCGLTPSFSILDDDDQIRLLKQILEAENVDTKKWPARAVLAVISRWKDRALRPEDLSMADAGDMADGKILSIYRQYQQRLKTLNSCDFGDLLLHIITILKNPDNAHLLQEYQRRFRYILVDEYQDTNVAQYLWLRLLASGHKNICCVGDDDQSIYGWRGAEVGNILRFEKDFPGAVIIRLEQNYRSTRKILQAASGIIANNENRLGKTLWSDQEEGDNVIVRGLWDSDAEARFVAEDAERAKRKGTPYSKIAILVRAGFQMRSFEERFIREGIPYRVIGGPRFYERQEVRDAIAYLRVVSQPQDDLAFERIINTPKRGIGDTTIQQLHGIAREQNLPLTAATEELLERTGVRPALRATLTGLMHDFNRWRTLVPSMTPADLTAQILDESGYTAMWQADKSPEAPGRLENLKELVSGLAEFESIAMFLEHVSLVMENHEDRKEDSVTLMTLHGAKGLEFDRVYLPGWEEGTFPSQRSLDETGVAGLEEERRLAYVGLTRARKQAIISHVANRRVYGNWVSSIPSRFIEELPEAAFDLVSDIVPSYGSQPTQEAAPRYQSRPEPSFREPRFSSNSGGSSNNSRWGNTEYQEPSKDRFNPSARNNAQQNGNRFNRPAAAPQRSAAPATSPRNLVGKRVSHDAFGEGKIVHVDGKKLDILFDDGEQRRVMESFVTFL